jgi:hypothetical protein
MRMKTIKYIIWKDFFTYFILALRMEIKYLLKTFPVILYRKSYTYVLIYVFKCHKKF